MDFFVAVFAYRVLQADLTNVKCSKLIDLNRSQQEKDSVFFMLFQK